MIAEPGTTKPVLPREDAALDRGFAAARPACYHCGLDCGAGSVQSADRWFCCHGCETVHDLLKEAGLGHFYNLEPHPGVRVGGVQEPDRFSFLSHPEVRERLLDFTDGKVSRVTFHVPAIHCIACVWLLENLYRLHPGIGESRVHFPKREVSITFREEAVDLGGLVRLLAAIGYEPVLTLGDLQPRVVDRSRRLRLLQVGVAGFAFGNIMLLSIPSYFGMGSGDLGRFPLIFGVISLVLAIPVVIFSAADYWRAAWLALRRRLLTLDVPIALGLGALYAQSAVEILTGRGEGYLDSLAGLVFFLLCGRIFQQKTYERLSFDRDFRSFFPLSTLRRTPSGGQETIPVSQVAVGDRLWVRNGELIPADAHLTAGEAWIDYSFVTGESEPVRREPGERLYAGGQQIGGLIEVETIKPVSQSYLTSLWDSEAFRKVRTDDLDTQTNRYSRRFTAMVLTVAVTSCVAWLVQGEAGMAVKAFTSILIVACPCALALAAPFTLGSAQRWLARAGIFLKNSTTLEHLARVDFIALDKTGTLTEARKPTVRFLGDALKAKERSAVEALTRASTHPHSRAIHESLHRAGADEAVSSFLETPGRGLEGRVGGHELWLGSRALLEGYGAEVPASSWAGSVSHLAIDGRYRGSFTVTNELRPGMERLERLRDHAQLALLSGDQARERERFTSLFGEDGATHFNLSPAEKLEFVRSRQEEGRTVLMVGDGLNDAGALRQADVGMAVVEQVGSFSPASDVILGAARIGLLPDLLTYARRAARIVQVGFGISAAYNVVGIGIAAFGLLSPVICAVLMPLSSVSVVLFACGASRWAGRRFEAFDLDQSGARTLRANIS